MPASWLDPRLEIRASLLHGRGTFTTDPIAAGEVVTIWEHCVLNAADLAAAPPGKAWLRADGRYVWVPRKDPEKAEHFLNHACEPNLWMANEVTLVARHSISAGEELTADYALWELDPDWISHFRCACRASTCRGVVTGRDWQLPELQQRYAGHFHPMLSIRIAGER